MNNAAAFARRGMPLILSGLAVATLSLIPAALANLTLGHQAALGLTLLLLQGAAHRLEDALGRPARLFICAAGLFLAFRYWTFRTTMTLGYNGAPDFVFALLLYAAETYGILIYLLGMFVNVWPFKREPVPLPEDPGLLPEVDVLIPTYNEPVEILRTTVMACTQMFYPAGRLHIYILDDGGTAQKLADPDPARAVAARDRARELKELAAEFGVHYVTREKNVHAKAGNVNEMVMDATCSFNEDAFDQVSCVQNGFAVSSGQLVLILDCDHIPARDFLQKTVGFFLEDEKLFLVQTPHYFINPDPVERNLGLHHEDPSENEMFYGAVQLGLDFWNSSFFCGSAAIIRRKHLMEIGGLAGETITEDAETALSLHARGYSSAYLARPLICGLSPETFADFILQRSRWAQGMVQIFLLKNPLFARGLTAAQRLCYFNSCVFWFFGLARFVFFLSPLMLIFFGFRIYNASLAQVLAFALPHLISAYFLANYFYGRYRHPFFSELYETIQSIYLIPAIVSTFLAPRAPVFKVTPKAVSLGEDFLSHLALPIYLMFLAASAGMVAGAGRLLAQPAEAQAYALCLFWNLFNVILLLGCLGVIWEKRQLRGQHRYLIHQEAAVAAPELGLERPCFIEDLSLSGVGIRLAGHEPLPAGGRLELRAKDSYGIGYTLPLEVRHTRETLAGIHCGCRFVLSTREERMAAVAFVYGDSSRWRYFHEIEAVARLSNLRGLARLFGIGLRGAAENAGGLARLAWRAMRGGWRSLRPHGGEWS